MGTITSRTRKDGSVGYTAQIRIKRDGKLLYNEAQTFDRRANAASWLKKREGELDKPGAIERAKAPDPTFGEVIRQYLAEAEEKVGRSKRITLQVIERESDLARKRCSEIASADIVAFATGMKKTPVTTYVYLTSLTAIFTIARPAWGYPLEKQAMEDAQVALWKMGAIANSTKRERRPTVAEIDALMTHFTGPSRQDIRSVPMAHVIAFAMFSARRAGEIVRIRWDDLDPDRVLVRDMKHPRHKIGNHTWCDLTPEALRIVELMPRSHERIFPFSRKTISSIFGVACNLLGIEDLTFHDLRHEGCSRLFELAWTIPQVAAVSGHRSWSSLKRYTHLRHTGDRWAAWPWFERLQPLEKVVPRRRRPRAIIEAQAERRAVRERAKAA